MSKIRALLVALAIAVSALLAGGATPVEAWRSGCGTWNSGNSAFGSCQQGTDWYQVRTTCVGIGGSKSLGGPWRTAPTASIANCSVFGWGYTPTNSYNVYEPH